jgi:carboxypeptidase C (cathepsin A)
MIKLRALACSILLLTFAAKAQEVSSAKQDTVPKPIAVSTAHKAMVNGKSLSYNAVAGRMEVLDDTAKPMALFGYTSYTLPAATASTSKSEGSAKPQRPIVFAFNGGPGSSSVWLHMGALGPKRVRVNDPNPTPNAPYTLEDNARSILDVADIVMIDPMGTGISVPLGKKEMKDFWGVDEDIESISAFIKQYLIREGRMNSPRFLLGESYGTFRNAGIMNHMQGQGIAFNGVVMVSAVFDLLSLTFPKMSDLPYIMHLPSYATTAWYHDRLSPKPADFEAFVDEVRRFTEEEYAPALYRGDRLSSEEKQAMASRLSGFTGLSTDYWLRANLRVNAGEFFAELLRDEGAQVGRLDSRYRGINQSLLSQTGDHDPFTTSLGLPYTSTFLDYYYGALGMDPAVPYSISAYRREGFKWNWDHLGNASWGTRMAIQTATDMAQTMSRNPYTKVLIMNGYFDLGTPFYAVEHTLDHLGLTPEIRANITMTYYMAGHMMYTDEDSFDAFAKDLRTFISEASQTKQ